MRRTDPKERGEKFIQKGVLCVYFWCSVMIQTKHRGRRESFLQYLPAFFLLGSHGNTKRQLSCFGSARPMTWTVLAASEIYSVFWNAFWAQLPLFRVESHMTLPCKALYLASPAILQHTALLYFLHACVAGLSPLSYSFIYLLRSSQTCLCLPMAEDQW